MKAEALINQLDNIKAGLGSMLPEISITATLLLLILFDLIFKDKKEIGLLAIGISGIAFTLLITLNQWSDGSSVSLFEGLFVKNNQSTLLNVIILITWLIVILQGYHHRFRSFFFKSSEALVLGFSIVLGTFLMTSASNLLAIYVAIELTSLSSYGLTALSKGKKKAEAGTKYLIYGAVASAAMLYGMSWLYGFTGSLSISDAEFISVIKTVDVLPLSIAAILTLAGVLFKLGAFPMHIWSPDVYEAAPTPVITLFSVVPKLGAIAILIKLSLVFQLTTLNWTVWIGSIAAASILIGNFSALWQKDMKRLMAYSSIAHAGFLLLAFVVPSESSFSALFFYTGIYAAMNIAGFYLIQSLEDNVGSSALEDIKGIGPSIPYIGTLIIITMIALVGLPPTAGFNAKLYLFSALWESYQIENSPFLLFLLIFGLLNAAVALFYYLKIPFYLFFKTKAENRGVKKIQVHTLILGTLLVLPLLLWFFRSDWLVYLLNNINFGL